MPAGTPYRTGIPTLKRLAAQMSRILTIYLVVMSTVLTTEEMEKVTALQTCLEDFSTGVSNPRPYDPV